MDPYSVPRVYLKLQTEVEKIKKQVQTLILSVLAEKFLFTLYF
jgi:hypothetical protein